MKIHREDRMQNYLVRMIVLKKESLYIVHVIEEFGESIQDESEQHELRKRSKTVQRLALSVSQCLLN